MGVMERILQSLSGNSTYEMSKQLVFQKVIGVKGLSSGVGTSTVTQNLAYYFSKHKNLRVCVIDTSFLNPIQHVLLGATKPKRDMLAYTGEIEHIADYIAKTKYKNISLVSMINRNIVDMMDKDDSKIVIELLQDLKLLFDVILIDISNEPTLISTELAVKCNKIVSIADQSVKCIYNIKDTINHNSTLALPLEKIKLCVLNRVVEGVKTTTVPSLEEAGLSVVSQVPLNTEIARLGITGEMVLAFSGESDGFFVFERTIKSLGNILLENNVLNAETEDPFEEAEQKSASKWNIFSSRKNKDSQGQKEIVVKPINPVHNNIAVEPLKPIVSEEQDIDTFDNIMVDDLDNNTPEVEEVSTSKSEKKKEEENSKEFELF